MRLQDMDWIFRRLRTVYRIRIKTNSISSPVKGTAMEDKVTEQTSTVQVRTTGPLSVDRADRMLRDPVGYFAAERERVRGDVEAEMARAKRSSGGSSDDGQLHAPFAGCLESAESREIKQGKRLKWACIQSF
ncbi:Uncharacterised protein [Mycobacteroides abscessus subsp. massiliense]|nr:Uncharacterised protein [Mycobacteroides abscessus subsp. massiliense]SLJ50054.1 Uncharacterised protein [Mycobacteroides abscessus subsp. abscessus]